MTSTPSGNCFSSVVGVALVSTGASAACGDIAAKTSFLTILPRIPLPVISAISTP
ncbi:hypothetical protein SAM_0906 [Streptococcus agalactiae CJB111]|nr:hypothetical protein SAM_0906 [Streptococcus agalactiae CJB111]